MTSEKQSVCILGSGESGMGAVRLAVKQGLSCFLSDGGAISKKNKKELRALGVDFEEKAHTINLIKANTEIIKSPGIPESAQVIQNIRQVGLPIISEIEFASRYTDAKIIGITGSNGKTTTTLLVTHLLQTARLDAQSAGNVGNSLSNLLLHQSPSIIVLELSSFQLDDIDQFEPEIATVLNISPDHLDRYENQMGQYADAKFNIVKNMNESDVFIYNADDEYVQERINGLSVQMKPIRLNEFVMDGAYSEHGYAIFNSDESSQVCSQHDLPLVGNHNLYNQMVAIQIALEVGVNFGQIIKGLSTFKNAPHRLEQVAEIESVRFINDSKATNVDAVFYALDAMQSDVVLIAGGVNKGNDYSQIKSLVRDKVRALICLGTDNKHLLDAFSDYVELLREVDSAEEAVKEAFKLSTIGGVVLLSPACASFDLFESYEDRGDQFKEAVFELKKLEESKHVNI